MQFHQNALIPLYAAYPMRRTSPEPSAKPVETWPAQIVVAEQ